MSSSSRTGYSRRIVSGRVPRRKHAEDMLHRDPHFANDWFAAKNVGAHGNSLQQFSISCHQDLYSYREKTDTASGLVYHDQGAGGQVYLVLSEGGQNRSFQVNREHVLGADLQHARSALVG